jgi:UDP-glucose 4-epimerase
MHVRVTEADGTGVLECIHVGDLAEGRLAAFYADPTLVETLFGWKAQRGIDEMCRDSWRWRQAQPAD